MKKNHFSTVHFPALSPLRERLPLLFLSSLILFLQTPPLFSEPSHTPPNILLIISDDLRDRLGCYGNPEIKTPNLDALAQKGVRFENAYVQYPVCGPSRASFMTGLRPEQTQILGNSEFFRTKLPDIITLPQSFLNAGYYTACFGKVFHVGHGDPEPAVWMDSKNSWSEAQYVPNVTPDMPKENYFGGKKAEPDLWGPTNGPEENQPDFQTATLSLAAMKKAGAKPWFVAAGFHRPHSPYVCPQKYFDLYNPKKLTLYKNPEGMTSAPPLAIPWTPEIEKHYKGFTEEEQRQHLWAYYACISYMDAQVGRLMEGLKKSGMDQNTIIIFMGDNGYHLGERDWWNKVTLFERSCRVPFIMAGPGISKNKACKAPIELIDLYPTLNALCSVKGPSSLPGESFQSLLKNPEGPGKGYAFSMVARGKENLIGRSVRIAGWRYTEWDEGRQGIELYDENNDHEEIRDLSKNPENKPRIASMKALFEKLPKIDPISAPSNTATKK